MWFDWPVGFCIAVMQKIPVGYLGQRSLYTVINHMKAATGQLESSISDSSEIKVQRPAYDMWGQTCSQSALGGI